MLIEVFIKYGSINKISNMIFLNVIENDILHETSQFNIASIQ